jgi:hypothetical protein
MQDDSRQLRTGDSTVTKEQLAEAHATVIRKHYRRLEDHPGRVHDELLADLAVIADQHAAEVVGGAIEPPFTLGVPVVACETVKPMGEPFDPSPFGVPPTKPPAGPPPRPRRTNRSTDRSTDPKPVA